MYRWLEYVTFGRELERRRFRYLAEVAGTKRALILGDGDGRFLSRFAAVSSATIDYVDASAGMLENLLGRARGTAADGSATGKATQALDCCARFRRI